MSHIAKGDVVVTNNKERLMYVYDVSQRKVAGDFEIAALCIWFENNTICESTFDIATLRRACQVDEQ